MSASNTTVALVRCPRYEPSLLDAAIEQVFRLLPDAAGQLRKGAHVLLKPNLVSSSDRPEKAVNTHPEIIRAVASHCVRKGCSVSIGDSCGSLAPGSTARAMAVTDLHRVAAETGAALVNFDTDEIVTVPIPDGKLLREIRIAKSVLSADVLLTLPKLKTHGLTLFTGAVKNQFGVVPGRHKKDTHLNAPKPALMAQALVDIFSVAKPHIAIMDGVVGMEGRGPVAGTPRGLGLLLASTDAVAVDAVASAVIGYTPAQVLTSRFAAERLLGIADLASIRVAGVPLRDACVSDYARPSQRLNALVYRMVPEFAIRWMFDLLTTRIPVVNHDACVSCGLCIQNCPAKALSKSGKHVIVDGGRCISCYCCTEVCDRRAIAMRRRLASMLGARGRSRATHQRQRTCANKNTAT